MQHSLFSTIWPGFAAISLCLAPLCIAQTGISTVTPTDHGKALINPNMGWTMHYYTDVHSNYGSKLEPSDTLEDFPGVSTVYLRLPWAYLEPVEGQYNWAIFDTPAQRWISKGKRIALRLTCSENFMKYATPKWVQDAGAKGIYYEYPKGPVKEGGMWDPVFNDRIFLTKLETFLAAFAKRYDGNPNVEFIDVGTYGLWGEGQTHASSLQDNIEYQMIHIDLHLKHFKKTLLCISDDFAGYNRPGKRFPITDYAFSKGITLRDDSIISHPDPKGPPWHHAEMAELFWPKFPVILEHQHYGPAIQHRTWNPQKMIASVEAYHASFMSIHGWPREILQDNRPMIDSINRRMGYRLMPVSVTWQNRVIIASTQDSFTQYGDVTGKGNAATNFKVAWSWANKGVAPCYPGGHPALTFRDDKGGIVSVLVDESFNMRSLEVGEIDKAPVKKHVSEFMVGLYSPTTRPGTYDVYLSVGTRDGTPVIELPIEGDDGQRRYKIGTVELLEK